MLRAHKGEIPFLIWLMPFMVGIALQMYTGRPGLAMCFLITGIAAGLTFIILNLFYNTLKVHRYAWLGGVLLHIAILCLGWLCSYGYNQLYRSNHFSYTKAEYLTVRVVTEPKQKGVYTRFTADVLNTLNAGQHKPVSGKLLITLVTDSNAHPVSYGDLLLVTANYQPVDPPFNPAEFNYRQYLARQNIYHQSFITPHQFVLLKHNTGNPLTGFALRTRQRLVNNIKQYISNPEAAAIASTLLLGYKADLSPDVMQAYAKTGTIHVLSVSGAHVAILFWLITVLLKPFRQNGYGRMFNAGMSILLIWAYAVLTGLSPAVCRAAVMLSLLIIGRASGRPVHYLNVLAVSAFALLLYNPFLLTDVGFQLSYLAVFGLVVLLPAIYEQLTINHKWLQKLWYACAASIAAQLITFPLSACYFHQFPVYFLLSNLLVILPVQVIMATCIAFLLSTGFAFLSPVSTVLASILQHSILLMNNCLVYIEHLPHASLGKIWFSHWQYVLLYVIIGCLIYFIIYKKVWQLGAALTGLLILCSGLSWKAVKTQKARQIVFFNVKQNSAVLFQSGSRGVIVTDMSPNHKNYQYCIQPALDSLGIDSITLCSPKQNISTTFLRKELNYIQFMDKSVLMFNPSLQKAVLTQKIYADYLFFTGNAHNNLNFIRNNYNFKYFIADANNTPRRLKDLKHQADSLGLNIFFLKRNNSFVVASNQ